MAVITTRVADSVAAVPLLIAMRIAGMLLYLSPDACHIAYEAPFTVPDALKSRASEHAEALCRLVSHAGAC